MIRFIRIFESCLIKSFKVVLLKLEIFVFFKIKFIIKYLYIIYVR